MNRAHAGIRSSSCDQSAGASSASSSEELLLRSCCFLEQLLRRAAVCSAPVPRGCRKRGRTSSTTTRPPSARDLRTSCERAEMSAGPGDAPERPKLRRHAATARDLRDHVLRVRECGGSVGTGARRCVREPRDGRRLRREERAQRRVEGLEAWDGTKATWTRVMIHTAFTCFRTLLDALAS